MEAVKSGQTAGISFVNVGCTLVVIKLWKRIALLKMLYGAELWTLYHMKPSKLEEVQNTFFRVCLCLLGGMEHNRIQDIMTCLHSHRYILFYIFEMECVKICRFKTLWMSIFAWGILLQFRCFNIHVKMFVLLRCAEK